MVCYTLLVGDLEPCRMSYPIGKYEYGIFRMGNLALWIKHPTNRFSINWQLNTDFGLRCENCAGAGKGGIL